MLLIIDRECFIKVMNNKDLDLPMSWSGENFLDCLRYRFDNYLKLLSPYLDSPSYDKLDEITNSIWHSVEQYYLGFPHKAYTELSGTLEYLYENYLIKYRKSQPYGLPEGTDPLKLFRVRLVKPNNPYDRRDLFHTPFNLRSKVSSCRYSISGYPSLYLSTSVPLCVKELKRKSKRKKIIASRFEFQRGEFTNGGKTIDVIELAIKPKDFFRHKSEYNTCEETLTKNQENRYSRRLFDEIALDNPEVMSGYVFWYPLILACSFIRTNKSEFSPEYVVPQLLMQWIRVKSNQEKLIGIRYFSCASKKISDMGFNYVLPVFTTEATSKNGFCDNLASIFHVSSPAFLDNYPTITECERHLCADRELKSIWD